MDNKAVLISIQPKWCDLIASGQKTIEIRKNAPKLQVPFTCYIYETKTPLCWNAAHNAVIGGRGGKVIGEFTCDKIVPIRVFENGSIQDWNAHSLEKSCVSYDDMADYIGAGKTGRGWHISDLQMYETPLALSSFSRPCDNSLFCESCAMYLQFSKHCGNEALKLSRPPQSWCYVQEIP